MKAGRLKYKLELLRPVILRSSTGAERVSYEPTAVVHAERVRMSGSRSDEVGEHFADYRAAYNIRDAHEVAENWRVRQLGGNLYTVTDIVPNIDRGYLTLGCERVNE